jgi:hypothetical protein
MLETVSEPVLYGSIDGYKSRMGLNLDFKRF